MNETLTLRPYFQHLRDMMLADIINYVNQEGEINFENGKKLSSARESIDGVVTKHNEFFVTTHDIGTGEGLYHDLDDERFVLLEDLLWIHEQILNKRVGHTQIG